jgi:hypothetical protein
LTGSEQRRRNTNSTRSRSIGTHKRSTALTKNGVASPSGKREHLLGYFNAYDIDFGNAVLASDSSTSSSNDGHLASRYPSMADMNENFPDDMLIEGSYFDPAITGIAGSAFEPYPAWDNVMDTDLLSTPLANANNYTAKLAPMPIHQSSHVREASSGQAAAHKDSFTHPVDSEVAMLHSSPHIRTHSPTRSINGYIVDPTVENCKVKTVTFQNLYDDDIITIVQDSWAGFRCNQTRPNLPNFKITSMHLKGLAEMLHSQDVWEHWPVPTKNRLELAFQSRILCTPLSPQSRDIMSSMFQSMLQYTFHVHGLSHGSSIQPDFGGTHWDQRLNATRTNSYVVLPPANILETFLQSYVDRIEHLYPSVCGSEIQPNLILTSSRNPEIPALLLLLMIAAGATGSGRRDSFYFTNGLTEVCRVSLWQLSEHNADLRSDLMVLRCTLLLTILAAWSGDKCQMHASMGNRAVYLNMLSQSGLLNGQSHVLSLADARADTNSAWQQWKNAECGKRYVFSTTCYMLAELPSIAKQFKILIVLPDWHTPGSRPILN